MNTKKKETHITKKKVIAEMYVTKKRVGTFRQSESCFIAMPLDNMLSAFIDIKR